jgi:hypothetical protein
MWLKAILDHLKGNPLEYVLILIVVFGIGWQGSSLADVWLAKRIDREVAEEMQPHLVQMNSLSTDVAEIKQGLDGLILSSIKRNIVEVKTLLCYSPGDPRLVRQYEELQADFEGMMGRRYEAPGCEVLKKVG